MVDFNISDGSNEEVAKEEAWPLSDTQKPLGDGTPLFDIKSRREQIVSGLVKSFQVPRWEHPEIYCEISPIEPSALATAIEKRKKQQKTREDWVTWAYCDIIAPSVKRVYAKMEETPDAIYSLRREDWNGEPTKIDHDLARALGLSPEDTTASETFRRLFFAEGDVIEFANQVFAWSAVTGEDADENF